MPLDPSYHTDAQFLGAVLREAYHARAKFPHASNQLAALTEEVGELAKALLDESGTRVWEEAVQVAAMALRIATEGDESFGRKPPRPYGGGRNR